MRGWLTTSMWLYKRCFEYSGPASIGHTSGEGRQASVELLQFGQDILVNVIPFGLGVYWLVCLEGGMRKLPSLSRELVACRDQLRVERLVVDAKREQNVTQVLILDAMVLS